jgi:hypothetical protein
LLALRQPLRGLGEHRCLRCVGCGRLHQEGQEDIAGGTHLGGKFSVKRLILARLEKQDVKGK